MHNQCGWIDDRGTCGGGGCGSELTRLYGILSLENQIGALQCQCLP